MPPIVSLNGHLVQADTPLISPFDRGFTVGDGLFETMKVTDGTVWYLSHHLDRLAYGAARLKIVVPPELPQWIDDVVRQAGLAGLTEHGLRITLTRGVALTHGLAENAGQEPTVVITAFEKPHVPATVYERGIRVQTATARRNERAATVGIKTTSYMESILALRDATAAGYDDAIFLDTRGFVAEATTSNVFLFRNKVLTTPPYTCGVLPGITRAAVLDLAIQAGIPTAECEVTHRELLLSEEVFLTSSLRGIVPVSWVDQIPIGLSVPGRRTRQMMERYEGVTERV
jgi:branched-chain amino acid aminotransferase